MPNFALISDTQAETLDVVTFDTAEFANACGVTVDWVHSRVSDGVIAINTTSATASETAWRFDSACVVRARRIVRLELTFDADPQLAALTTDLIEEVERLRMHEKAALTKQHQQGVIAQ